jgi:general stress protein 26
MVNGIAVIVNDKAKMEQLMDPGFKAWFPDGLDDVKLKLLKVQPHEVEYWNADSSKIERVFKIVKALIKGDEYKEEDHKKVIIT